MTLSMARLSIAAVFAFAMCPFVGVAGEDESFDHSPAAISPPFFGKTEEAVKEEVATLLECQWREMPKEEEDGPRTRCFIPGSTFEVGLIRDQDNKLETIDILAPWDDAQTRERLLKIFPYFFPQWRIYETWEKDGVAWIDAALTGVRNYRFRKAMRMTGGVVVLAQSMDYPSGSLGNMASFIFTRNVVAGFYRFPDEADGDPLWGEYIRTPYCYPPRPGRVARYKECEG